MSWRDIVPFTVALLGVLVLQSSCAHKQPQPEIEQDDLVLLKSIAVLPVVIPVVDEENKPSPKELEQLAQGKTDLNRIIEEYLAGNPAVKILSEEQLEAMEDDLSMCRTAMARAKVACKKIGSDAVLLCTLYRFRQREGTTYSVVEPASVSFEYMLLRPATGEVLCRGLYDETQQPLSENILSFFTAKKRGFKWVTADELAREGIANKFDACPYLKHP